MTLPFDLRVSLAIAVVLDVCLLCDVVGMRVDLRSLELSECGLGILSSLSRRLFQRCGR